jgi:hypothetical protein
LKPAAQIGLSVALIAVLAVGGFLLGRAWPLLFPDLEMLTVDPACALRAGPCERALPGGGRLRFGISPRHLPLMQPLQLTVELQGLAVQGIQVDIVGLNMDMGPNRTRLQRVDGVWSGSTVLPVCSRSVMQWQAAVWLEQEGQTLAVPHRFETRRDD